MAMAVFPFTFLRRGYVEYPETLTAASEQSGGRRVMQRLHATTEFVARGSLLFPRGGYVWADLLAFWSARSGPFEAFLYRPQDAGAAAVQDAFVAVAAQTDFDAARRYVDTATLVVKKGGVTQTLGVHYTVENESGGAYVLGTSTKLVVAFGAAPGAGVAVTLDYEFYYPVRFEGDELLDSQDLITGGAVADLADRTVSIRLREAGPGWHLAAVPTSL